MRTLIIGGGKVGYYLAKALIENGHDISVIEKDKTACQKFANELDVTIIRGNGTDASVLEQAGVENADCVISVTGRDEDNLVVCQLAKKLYAAGKSIAKVNNPKNVEVFKKLGVDMVVSATDSLAHLLEREAESGKIKEVLPLENGKTAIFEVVLDENFKQTDAPLAQMSIPITLNIISIVRNTGEVIIPRGHATLKTGDKLLIICKKKDVKDILPAFGL